MRLMKRLGLPLAITLIVVAACTTPDTRRQTPSASQSASAPSPTDTIPSTPAPTPLPTASPSSAADEPVMAVQIAECDHDSGVYRVQVPDGWWVNPTFTDAELGPVSACQFFGPEPFDVTTGNLDQPRPAGAAVSIEFIDGGCVGYLYGILSSREVIVAGLQGSITEEAGSPGGTEAFTYQYLVILAGPGDCGPADKAITGTTRREDAGDYDENTEILDTMMETIAVTFP